MLYCSSVVISKTLLIITSSSQGEGALRISSDGDDRKFFLGLKFSISGFFREGNLLEPFAAVRLTPRTPDLEVRGSSLACRVVSLEKELYSTLSPPRCINGYWGHTAGG